MGMGEVKTEVRGAFVREGESTAVDKRLALIDGLRGNTRGIKMRAFGVVFSVWADLRVG